MSRLLYVGQQVADELRNNIFENISRYKEEDFLDLEAEGDWRIPLSFDVDLDVLQALIADGKPESEVGNSMIVGRALQKMTPTLARENRIWIRLSHIECLKYSRDRWLHTEKDDEEFVKDVSTHFFAPTLTGCRDDHAISRLWWNHQIAKQIMPEAPERALKKILALADIRQGLVERPGIGARPALGRGIIRILESTERLVEGKLFGRFIKKVNLNGAGIAFEVWNESRIDQFMADCLEQAESEPKG
ncbi:DUF6339 family protein [Stenotrophomonas acidaminiphila]|uniref:DUF6339 family protein n=1 Tax=Stenotrophomonas acidaminiphila TaxID=128780 RepID=UPI001FB00D52